MLYLTVKLLEMLIEAQPKMIEITFKFAREKFRVIVRLFYFIKLRKQSPERFLEVIFIGLFVISR